MKISRSPLPRMLALMRVSLHVLFAALVLVGLGASAAAGAAGVTTLALALALSAAYLAGTVAEHRGVALPRAASYAWLGLVLVLWTALVVDAAQFVWLLFPLVFLILHVLPWATGLAVVAAGWLVAAGVPVLTGQSEASVGGFLGPAIGTVAAVVGYHIYQALRADAAEQRRVAEKLRATQAELAATENRAGRLAERERLSREIHDTLAQGLSSIVLLSRAAGKSLSAGESDTARSQVEAIEAAASENLAEARRFVSGLAAPSLTEALEAVVETRRTQLRALDSHVDLRLNVSGAEHGEPDDEVAGAVLRVAQEAVSNALRHADPSSVVVTYAAWPDQVTLDVVDDGRGFDPSAGTAGYGLAGLRARVAEKGGTLTVESTSAGTAVAAAIPRKDVS